MSLNDPKPGFNYSTEFQIPGLPWVLSGSAGSTATCHAFDKVAKKITIKNHEAAGTILRVGFTQNGVDGVGGKYYFGVDGGDTFSFETRVKEVYLKRDGATDVKYSIFAELTTIGSNMMPVLTGSFNGTTYWNGVG